MLCCIKFFQHICRTNDQEEIDMYFQNFVYLHDFYLLFIHGALSYFHTALGNVISKCVRTSNNKKNTYHFQSERYLLGSVKET